MIPRRPDAFFLLILLLVFSGFTLLPAQDAIRLEDPLVTPDTPENRRMVGDFLDRATVHARRTYGEHFVFAPQGDYSLRFIISLDSGPVGSLVMKRGKEEYSLSYFGGVSAENLPYVVSLAASLWNAFTGILSGMESPPPELVDVLPAEYILASVPTLMPALVHALAPMAGTVRDNGNLLVAFGSLAVELDSHLGFVGVLGADLLARGDYTGAGGVFVTPAGTVLLKPSTGRVALRYPAGGGTPEKVPLGMDPYGPVTLLHDGRIVAQDIMTRTTWLIDGRKRTPLSLSAGVNSYLGYLGTGPEGTIWSWDTVERRFKIHTAEDIQIGSIVPIAGPAATVSPGSFAICPDGGFIMTGSGAAGPVMVRYGRDGIPLWQVDSLDLPFPESLPMNPIVIFDPVHGYVYLLDMTGKRIIRFLDRSWCEAAGVDTAEADRLLDLRRGLAGGMEDGTAYGRMAELYLEQGAVEPALSALDLLLEENPYDRRAGDLKTTLETGVLKKQATAETTRALELLRDFGPSTGQEAYTAALRLYEKILHLAPGDEESRKAMEDLQAAYAGGGAAPARGKDILTPEKIELQNLFPSLMLYYRKNPAGRIHLRNNGNTAVEGLEVSLFIPRYMDYPAVSRYPGSLLPGEEAEIELFAQMNDQVLSLQEDLPVQARVEVSWDNDGGGSFGETGTLTLYRNTSLSWDYSGKLAAFITPNEQVVSLFAHRILGNLPGAAPGFPKNLIHGALLCDALGAYGIRYIEDPDSPFSAVLGREEVLDTVRFPRTTLFTRTGDCDDTTALLSSLLESSGIPTAIMTSPGHVFLAFDSGEPVENRRLFVPSGYEVISHENRVWIPVETTVLSQGFPAAWESASMTIREHPGELEFIPLADERDTYPPLPLVESSLPVVEPQSHEVGRLFNLSMGHLTNLVYHRQAAALEEALSSASGREVMRLQNSLGALHARFGNREAALALFSGNLELDPEYPASYLNLANLYILEGRTDRAREVLLAGIDRKPDSSPLNFLLARIYAAEGSEERADEYYARAEAAAPELAAGFVITREGDEPVRAGLEDLAAGLVWNLGED
ncbi:MAG: tetratricopeptide repeat protein [Spirochaetales bacterium]|nr:tetratricopeptide repeat protein [Spirochaetales bacterium]